jgi:hypothetical protein
MVTHEPLLVDMSSSHLISRLPSAGRHPISLRIEAMSTTLPLPPPHFNLNMKHHRDNSDCQSRHPTHPPTPLTSVSLTFQPHPSSSCLLKRLTFTHLVAVARPSRVHGSASLFPLSHPDRSVQSISPSPLVNPCHSLIPPDLTSPSLII